MGNQNRVVNTRSSIYDEIDERVGHVSKYKKLKIVQIICPLCLSRAVSTIGPGRYFCADCCTEFKISGDQVESFSISIDGELLKIS